MRELKIESAFKGCPKVEKDTVNHTPFSSVPRVKTPQELYNVLKEKFPQATEKQLWLTSSKNYLRDTTWIDRKTYLQAIQRAFPNASDEEILKNAYELCHRHHPYANNVIPFYFAWLFLTGERTMTFAECEKEYIERILEDAL